jgi:hypothetical protein
MSVELELEQALLQLSGNALDCQQLLNVSGQPAAPGVSYLIFNVDYEYPPVEDT